MPGAGCARSLVCVVCSAHECSHHGRAGRPAFPHAMVLTAYFVLSPVIGLYCHRHQRIWFCLRPVGPTCLRKLDAGVEASGPHDFAVRELHLSTRPAITHVPNAAASTASRAQRP
jgi:hypothetical protein